jgi:hypothetical protein
MPEMFAMEASRAARRVTLAGAVLAALALGEGMAQAQPRDGLLNGAVIGAAVGAGVGVAFTHAVRDSGLGFGQYAYGGLVFAGLGAGVGLGLDALLQRALPAPGAGPRRVAVAPRVWRRGAGVVVNWRW